ECLNGKSIINDQTCIIMNENTVITLQENERNVFEPLRERLEESKGQIRHKNSDYLLFSIIDIIIDNYFLVIEQIGENINIIEELVETDPNSELPNDIHNLKVEIIGLKKSIWPTRDIINKILRDDYSKYILK
ncbi:MAG: CorA family divalent cation transporter, partial [Promethearchaeota archaeon]